MANEHHDSVRFFWDHNAMATKRHYCNRNRSVGTMATKQHYLVDLFCDRNGSVGTMAKQHYLADLICDHNGSVRSNIANRSKQNTFWLMYRVQKWHTLSSGFDKLHLRNFLFFCFFFCFCLSHSCYALAYAHLLYFYLFLIFLSFMYFLLIKLHFKYIHYMSTD